MGKKIEFKCSTCNYKVEVSGGRDCGMFAVVQTMVCDTCKKLVDVPIGAYGKDGPVGDQEWDNKLGFCSYCGGKNVSVWSGERACPKCSSKMVEGEMTLLWD